MNKPKFTPEQTSELLKNEHVTKCSSKAISYSKTFKVFAVRQYAEGKTAVQIFRSAGLLPELIGEDTPKDCLARWRRKLKAKGEAGLLVDERSLGNNNRKGRPKTKGLTDVDKIKRLEIENAYLKAKNDFLVKLRAQRKS